MRDATPIFSMTTHMYMHIPAREYLQMHTCVCMWI